MSEKSKPLTRAEVRARTAEARAWQQKGTFLKALGKWKVFLETTPPNTPLKIPDLVACDSSSQIFSQSFDSPPIQLHCERDDGPRRFEPLDENVGIPFSSRKGFDFIKYQCRDCRSAFRTFAVLLIRSNNTDVEVMKLGEYPPFSAPISSRIQKLLSESDLDLYRKGVRAEGQGLGIGAATYFRRVVDGQWQHLVTKIRDAAERLGEDLRVYDDALKEKQFSKAVEMLKGAIPAKLLLVGGENPLTLLYQPLSRQLHKLTDEECLREAADIRIVLTSLLENISDVLEESRRAPRSCEEVEGTASPNGLAHCWLRSRHRSARRRRSRPTGHPAPGSVGSANPSGFASISATTCEMSIASTRPGFSCANLWLTYLTFTLKRPLRLVDGG